MFLIDFRGRSPGQIRLIKKNKNTPRACSIAVFYGVYSVYNVNLEIGKLEVPGKFINYAACCGDQMTLATPITKLSGSE